ncbi:MAG: hypothetical protein KGL39_58700 [Patescibacteria group bacterium]|nr:hypothetical protein [Patescibacteria group bacterium]
MTHSISELRRLAEAASPGPWGNGMDAIYAGEETIARTFSIGMASRRRLPFAANAAFMVVANPATGLSLLRVVEAARALIDDLRVVDPDGTKRGAVWVSTRPEVAEPLTDALAVFEEGGS